MSRSLISRFATGLVAAVAAAPLSSAQGPLAISLAAPDAVEVGAPIELVATIRSTGDERLTVRDPVLDARSFEFQVRYGGGRESTYTAFHPGAGQGSNVKGQYLEPGAELTFTHVVPAIKAGEWRFQALYHGVSSTATVASQPVVVKVTKTDGASELGLRIETTAGTITARFWPEVAPSTAFHVAILARDGFYDGTKFHRVIKDFMIQGGAKDERGAGYSIPAEFSQRPHVAGVLSMARRGDPSEGDGRPPAAKYRDSARTSFFICDGEASYLDERYTAFGEVVEGLDVVSAIASAEVVETQWGELSEPVEPVVKSRVTLVGIDPTATESDDG